MANSITFAKKHQIKEKKCKKENTPALMNISSVLHVCTQFHYFKYFLGNSSQNFRILLWILEVLEKVHKADEFIFYMSKECINSDVYILRKNFQGSAKKKKKKIHISNVIFQSIIFSMGSNCLRLNSGGFMSQTIIFSRTYWFQKFGRPYLCMDKK